jgi:glucokinase
MTSNRFAIGVDLGGTKIVAALVDNSGQVVQKIRYGTDVKGGPVAVTAQIVSAAKELKENTTSAIVGMGVGVAGQVVPETGAVRFAPNLAWSDVPLRADLEKALGFLPVVVTNDVRAITLGEWLYGAGRGCDDLVCVFVGTGIGGGIVSRGRIITGCGNAAGEVGHMTIDLRGPMCTCGKRGCWEALAGGWAIGKRAQEAMRSAAGHESLILEMAGGKLENITARTVSKAFQVGDPLAREIVEDVVSALIVGAVNLVNIVNPCRLIVGGGVIDGMPMLLERIQDGVQRYALKAVTENLKIVPSLLGSDAGIAGAAALALQTFS